MVTYHGASLEYDVGMVGAALWRLRVSGYEVVATSACARACAISMLMLTMSMGDICGGLGGRSRTPFYPFDG